MTKQKSMMMMRLTRLAIHTLLILLLYYGAFVVRQHTDLIPGFQIRIPAINSDELIAYSIISVIIFLILGIIKKRYGLIELSLGSSKVFLSVWTQWTVSMTCLAYFGQGFLFTQGISRLIIVRTALGSLILIPCIESIRNRIYIHRMKQFTNSVLIVSHDDDQAQEIINQLKLPSYYDIHKKNTIGPLSHIDEDIIILVGSYTQDELQDIIDHTRLQNKQLYHISDHHFLEDVIYTPSKIGGLRALRYTSSQIEGRAAVIKRIFDIIASMVGIILTSPIMIITAIAIKIDSPGPIFYIQDRVGKNGKHFSFIKFRSMYAHLSVGKSYGGDKAQKIYSDLVHSHANVRQGELPKISNDPRVTKVGRFIRATSIDELPNFFSVLQGNMSLIGPRPHLPSEIANYKPRQKRVLSIKPGITGYAQIHGRDSLSFDEEATKELEYIQNRSLFLDCYIVIATFGVLFAGRGK